MPKNIGEKGKDHLVKELGALGLKEKEAMVYLALLELGEAGTSKISASTNLHSQLVYIALAALEEKGLAQHVTRRGRKKFAGKHPHALVRLAEAQKSLADNLSERLDRFASLPKESRFEVFQGNESYVAHEFDLLTEARFGSEVLIIEGKGNQFRKEMGARMAEYERLRLSKKISVRFLGSGDSKADMESHLRDRELFSYRLLPGLFTGQVGTDIWEHAIGFNVYGDPVTSSVHYNEVVAGSYRQFFETLWNLSRE